MAIDNVGLSRLPSTSSDFATTLRIEAGDAAAPLYLKWRTASGPDVQASFDVSVDFRCAPRGTESDGVCGYSDWDGGGWANIPASKCGGTQLTGSSGWVWSLDFADLLEACGLKARLADDGEFGFDERKFDSIKLQVNIKSHFASGIDWNGGVSPRTDTAMTVEYVPSYEIVRVYCDSLDAVKVDYVANDWERTDDRWAVELLDADGESILGREKPWGTVVRHDPSGIGTVSIPVASLASVAPVGDFVEVMLRFNPSYRAAGEAFATASFSDACQVDASCNTPTLSARASRGAVDVRVGDSGDLGIAAKSAIVKMDGAQYAFDQTEVPVGGVASFPLAPRGVPVSFRALAVSESGGISSFAEASVAEVEPEGYLVLVGVDDRSAKAVASYDVSLEDDYAPESESVKLAGRKRPCVYLGEGGEAKWSASFSIPPDCFVESRHETEAAWRAVAEKGDLAMLLPDGRRRVVSLESLKFSRPQDGGPVAASATMTEVDA